MMLTRSGALALLIGCSSFAQSIDAVLVERAAPRVRAGLGAGGMGGVVSPGLAVGLGVAGELGVVLADRFALSLRLSAATGFLFYGAATMNGEVAVTDRLSLGVGAGLATTPDGMPGSPGGVGVVFPLRGVLWPGDREASEARRRGFFVALSLAPGFSFAGRVDWPGPPQPKFPGFAFASELTLGYALF